MENKKQSAQAPKKTQKKRDLVSITEELNITTGGHNISKLAEIIIRVPCDIGESKMASVKVVAMDSALMVAALLTPAVF